MSVKRISLTILSIGLGLGLTFGLILLAIATSQVDISGPPGSGNFGATVTVLPNGNIVVSDPYYDAGGVADMGAVYLYKGKSGALISVLTGSAAGDQVGSFGVIVLPNGNYVVSNPYWDNGGVTDAGAVTWGDGTSGVTGTVSAANSLVGSTAYDMVGYVNWDMSGVMGLANGNYVVGSPYWDNGAVANAGAATWGNGMRGVTGTISAANSLVGSTTDDNIGCLSIEDSCGVTVLGNGNYLLRSRYWDNGIAVDAGAVTWGNGLKGVTGTLGVANSLVGSSNNDSLGLNVTELANGNYVAIIAGAATWGDGMSGVTGTVSVANSLVGVDISGGVTALANGNYVVSSPGWDNGTWPFVGAVTWGDGTRGVTGTISTANSLVGSIIYDSVGSNGVIALANGNYVVSSPNWVGFMWSENYGAATWGDGTTGVTGTVSAANSLVGSYYDEYVGYSVTALANGNYVVSSAEAATWGDRTRGVTGTISAANSLVGVNAVGVTGGVTALANGNYVVSSPNWDDGGIEDVGAVTWGDGATGVTGTVSGANSLVGSTAGDWVGGTNDWFSPVITLENGNYVVRSPQWDNGAVEDAGAVTWGDGASGVTGTVSTANSLVGSTAYDYVGSEEYGSDIRGVTALTNGNYVVQSPSWDNGATVDAGAVTWGDGESGITGEVSAANSLVGSTSNDEVSTNDVTALANGNYVVSSPRWDNGAAWDAGAVTWGDGENGITGEVSSDNSLVGSTVGDEIGFVLLGISAVTAWTDGTYVVNSPHWDNGATTDAGAVTWGDGSFGTIGPITADNSVRGEATYGGSYLNYADDNVNQQLVVGRPWDNIVTLFRLNDPPMANAGPDQTVKSSSTVTLDGSASHDPDGNLPLAYGWTQSGDITVTLNSTTAVSPTFTAPAVVTQTSMLTFTLVVSDSLGLSSLPDQVVIIVEPNDPPIADAGSDQMVKSLSTVTLDGSASHDPDGNLPLAYVWTQSGGTAVTLSNTTAVSPTFTAPAVVIQTSTLTFTLVVTDSLGLSSLPDQVVIIVEPNDPPLANAGSDQTVKSLSTVMLDGSASHDPDGNLPLAYVWTQSGDITVTLNSTTAVSPTFTAPAVVTQTSILTFTLVLTDSLGLASLPDQVVIIVEPYAVLLPVISNQDSP